MSQQLLLNVAEELKLPLLQIARHSEQAAISGKSDLELIQSTAETALALIDNYALGVRMSLDTQVLAVEPVSISSILYDSGQQLDAVAKSYGVGLEINIAGRYGPVMANRQGLQAALVSLGTALIEAIPAQGGSELKLQLATHRCRYGIVAGFYGDNKHLTAQTLQKGRDLHSKTRQPLIDISHTSGAGIFVADALLHAMDLDLKASRHHGLYGLGTILQPNHQMQLV